MRAKRVFEYERGVIPKKGLRVGKYQEGTVKDFEDVQVGDIAKDYNGSEWEVKDKVTMKIDYGSKPVNVFFPHVTDPKVAQFLELRDESGAMMDFLENGITADMDGEEIDLIAVSDSWSDVVWLYDDSGALVYW